MAALFPHETLPKEFISLEQFCGVLLEVSRREQELIEDRHPSYYIALLALCGRYEDEDGATTRVFIEEPDAVDESEYDGGSMATQHVGTMTGVVDDLDLGTDLAVHPLPSSRERMKNLLGIKLEVKAGVRKSINERDGPYADIDYNDRR